MSAVSNYSETMVYLTYISSNKYFRSAYGKKLRDFLARQSTLSQLIDFGDAPVFTSIAYPSIITASKTHAQGNHLRALNWEPGPSIDEFGTDFFGRRGSPCRKTLLLLTVGGSPLLMH